MDISKIKNWINDRIGGIILTAIVGLGFILRFANLGTQPFWGDEILSLDISR